MEYECYSSRTRNKLVESCKIYAGLVFESAPVALSPLSCLETGEHYRSVPAGRGIHWKKNLTPGTLWGGEWQNMWIKGEITVTAESADRPLYLCAETGAIEVLGFVNGSPAGMLNIKGDEYGQCHDGILLTQGAPAGTKIAFALECYAGHYEAGEGVYEHYDPAAEEPENFVRTFRSLRVCTRNDIIWNFTQNLVTVLDFAKLTAKEPLGELALIACDKIAEHALYMPKYAPAEEVIDRLSECTAAFDEFYEKARPLMPEARFTLIPQSHIDTAWRWPVRETIRKCARTFSEALALMDRYPEYRFTCSAMVHLEWMRVYYPDIFKRLQEKAGEGRFEIIGGSFVECDCSIPGGESFVKQFLYGQKFARKYFDTTCRTFWQPDTFGYNCALPQLMRSAHLESFYTTKLFNNDCNMFPHTLYRWEGIDGSRVTAHMSHQNTHPVLWKFARGIKDSADHGTAPDVLFLFGEGDGGGGCNEANLQYIRNLMRLYDSPEKMDYGRAQDFYDRHTETLPTYKGELYLETHRGVFTAQHEIKRSNREAEIALHNLELACALTGKGPDAEAREALWRVLMVNQFHDILPGTSMNGVNPLAVSQNDEMAAKARSLTANLLSGGDGLCLFNPTCFDRAGDLPQSVPAGDAPIKGLPRYRGLDGQDKAVLPGTAIPAFSSVPVNTAKAADIARAASPFTYEDSVIETPFYHVVLDEDGAFASFIDKKTGRELRKAGADPLNSFYTGEDVPATYDNWNIDYDALAKQRRCLGLIAAEVVLNTAEELRIRQTRSIAYASVFTQDIVFYASSGRVDFETRMDWHDAHQLVKVGFAPDIAADCAMSDIGFGHLRREIFPKTSEDIARFETCQHKWTDLSEAGYGVTLLNNCKYGISVLGGDLRLTLMKAGTHPDDTADEGVHYATYSLLPHEGGLGMDVVRAGYGLNFAPLLCSAKVTLPLHFASSSVVLETVKPAEDGRGLILRFFEAMGEGGTATFTLPEGYAGVGEVNVLEEKIGDIAVKEKTVEMKFGPYEVKSVRVW